MPGELASHDTPVAWTNLNYGSEIGQSRQGAGASFRALRNLVKVFLTSPRHLHCLG
jgi:hypothetical protein